MPNVNNISLTAPTDYGVELQATERRRKLAEALQQQSLQPIDQQTAGGYVIPISPTQGLAKMAQALAGALGQNRADDKEKAVAQKYQDDLVRVLREGSNLATGTPAQSPTTPNDDEGNAMPGVAARAPDPMGAAAKYLTHPATQALGLQEMQRQRMIEAFGLGGAQGASPTVTSQTGPQLSPREQEWQAELQRQNPGAAVRVTPGALGTPEVPGWQSMSTTGVNYGGAAAPSQAPANGMLVPKNIAYQLLLSDPSGKSLAEANAKAHAESVKPVNVRPGGAVWQQGSGVLFNQPQVGPGVQLQYGPNGPSASPIPGAAPAMAAQAGAVAGGTAAGQAPYQIDTVNTEGAPTMMTRQQQIEAATRQPMPVPGQMPQRPPQVPSAGMSVPPEVQAQRDADAQRIIAREGQPNGGGAIPTANVVPGLRLQDQGESAQQKAYGTERGQLLAARPQATIAARTALTNMERLSSVARELESHPGLSGITGKVNQYAVGDLLPETRAARALQETMVKQSAVQTLQAMRDASKTGGAVGAVTEKEWPILEQQLAALNGAQGTKDYQVALKNLQNQMAGAQRRIRDAYKDTYGEPLQFESTPYQTQGRSVRQQADEILNGKR